MIGLDQIHNYGSNYLFSAKTDFVGTHQVLPVHIHLSHDLASGSDITPCFWFGFVALRPMSTAMVIAGQSVHFTTLFPGQA